MLLNDHFSKRLNSPLGCIYKGTGSRELEILDCNRSNVPERQLRSTSPKRAALPVVFIAEKVV